ncbi:hypothetical protein TYM08_P3203 [Marinicellulosiphila megalodicopiae]
MLGQAVIRLYHKQYDIHFVGRNKKLGEQIAKQYNAVFHQVDLSDVDKLKVCCENMDAVIHSAALSSPWGKPFEFEQANIQGTANILLAAKQANVKKIVHISTPSLYFDFKSKINIKETDELPNTFCNEYASSKYAAEQLVIQSSIDSIILRPRGIFGPQDRAIAPRLLKFIKNDTLLLPSNRNPVVDLTYVDNVADAIHLSVNTDCEKGSIFNITNDEPNHIQAMLSVLLNALAPNTKIKGLNYSWVKVLVSVNQWIHKTLLNYKEPRLTDYSAALLHYDQTLDISKAKTILGYQPKITIDEGINRYAIWHKNPTI